MDENDVIGGVWAPPTGFRIDRVFHWSVEPLHSGLTTGGVMSFDSLHMEMAVVYRKNWGEKGAASQSNDLVRCYVSWNQHNVRLVGEYWISLIFQLTSRRVVWG